MTDLKRMLSDPQAFVTSCEEQFLSEITTTAEKIMNKPDLRVLLLAGPTCSGKTTAAKILGDKLKEYGKTLIAVSIDDFFHDTTITQDGKNVDFESIRALDFPYFAQTVEKILRREEGQIPEFDFLIRKRIGYHPIKPDQNSIVMFEGIQALYPEVSALMPHDLTERIFICTRTEAGTDAVRFSPSELRFLRRLVRDERARNTSAYQTYGVWESVVENENKNIFPYSSDVACQIDSTLAYEPFAIRDKAIELLSTMPDDTPYEPQRQSILRRLDAIPSVDPDLVPADSVFREFIGAN